ALVGLRDPAGKLLRMPGCIAEEGEHRYRIIPRLLQHHRVIDGAAIDARRCTGFQPAGRQSDLAQSGRQRTRWWVAGAAGLVVVEADMHQTTEERTGGQHHGFRFEPQAELRHDTGGAVALEQDVIDRLLEQPEIGLILQTSADGRLVQHAVGLRTRGPYRRSFAGIEDAELDTAFVRGRRHGATQRVDLLDQMSLADATDGWITGHLPQ